MTTIAEAGVPGEVPTMRIDHGATVTARMPTAEECTRGFQAGLPVLVVAHGGGRNVYPNWVALEFDDPHGQPDPDAVRDAAASVLRLVGEQLHLAGGRVADLAGALRRSPCSVAHLADTMREEEEDAWRCADASMCEPIRQPADGSRAGRPGPGRADRRG